MSRPLKITLAMLAFGAAAFVAVVAIIALRFDPNTYRPQIVAAVAESTGRPFNLDGELGLKLLPCCAVSLGAARLGNPAGFPDDNFATFESASASVRLWPLLLRREIEIGTFRIDGLNLNLVRLADGRSNWTFKDEAAPKAPKGEPSGATMGALRMEGVEAADAQISYRNLATGREYAATDVRLHTGTIDYQGVLTVAAPELTLTATGAELPNGRVDIALTAEHLAIVLGAGTLDLPGLALRIDESNITGEVAIADTGTLGFDLAIDRLNVDRYLPQAPDGKQSPAAESEPFKIPLELIRGLNLVGKLRVRELVMFRLQLADVNAVLRAADGVLRIDPLAARLYGGEYHGSATVDATGPQAVLTLDQQLAGMQVGDLLKSRSGNDRLVGALTGSVSGSSRGTTTRDLLQGFAGNVALDLANGVYRGTDFLYELRRAKALIKNNAPPPEPANKETPINALSLKGTLQDGVMRSDQIRAEIPSVQVRGRGDFDLLKMVLNYQLNAELLDSPDAPNGGEFADLTGKSIPFTVKGPAKDPRVRIDLEGLLAGEAQGALQRALRHLFRPKDDHK